MSASESKKIVEALYAAIKAGDIPGVLNRMDNDLQVSVPPVLPYGGEFKGLDNFLKGNLPAASAILDFGQLEVENIVAEGNQAVAIVRVGLQHSPEKVRVAEHWTIGPNGKVTRLAVFYFDPRPAMKNPAA